MNSLFQIDLSHAVDVDTNEVFPLLPLSRVILAEEQCQALVQATSDPDTTCVTNGDCTGLTCDLDASSDMVFVVDKCRDPVVVNITAFHGGVSTNSLIQNDWIFLGGGEYLAVQMSRNATDLNFTVSWLVLLEVGSDCNTILWENCLVTYCSWTSCHYV